MEPTLTMSDLASASFMQKVYSWMAGGLLVTGLIAYGVAITPSFIEAIFLNPFVFYGLILSELLLVIYLSARARTLSTEVASVLFFAYAALNGITLSLVFLVYTSGSLVSAFIITAGTFGLMSLYGNTTKTDLSTMGNIALMGLLGIILASVVNLFFQNSAADFMINCLAVLAFTALTAYDTQKIKEMRVPAVIGALNLYLDFINIFIRILQLSGKRR